MRRVRRARTAAKWYDYRGLRSRSGPAPVLAARAHSLHSSTGEGSSMLPTLKIQGRPSIQRSILGSLAIGLALLAAVTPAKAGIVDPSFAGHLATLPQDEQVSVIIMLAD